jgi:hypothetical protein
MAVDILGILTAAGYTFGAIMLAGIIYMLYRTRKNRQAFDYYAEIYERDNLGNLKYDEDMFGVMIDHKANMEMGFLKRSNLKVGLKDFSYQNIIRNGKPARRVSLLRVSDDTLIFLRPSITYNPHGNITYQATREDVDWAINTYEAYLKMFKSKDRFKEVMSLVLIGIAVTVVLVVLVLLLRQIPEITKALSSVGSSMASAANALKDAALATGGVVR